MTDKVIDPRNHKSGRPGFGVLTATCCVGLAAAIVFVGFPEIDFWVTDFFVFGKQAFILNQPGPWMELRLLFQLISITAVVATLAGLVLAIRYRRRFLTLGFPQWLFFGLCLLLGPALTTNVLLKDNWGRARPFHVEEYGGAQAFTPALMRSTSCRKNCSFVSGEAAAIYTVFFALAMLARRRRARLMALGVGAGTLAGFVRIGQGGHFLSDVVFAGVFMALIVRMLYWAVFEWGGEALRERGPVHDRLAHGGGTVRALTGRGARSIASHARTRWAPAAEKGLEALARRRMLPDLAARWSFRGRETARDPDERPQLERPYQHRPD